MIDFYLSVNNRQTVIQLPVPPAEFSVEKPQGNETFETAAHGWIKLIGKPELKSISFSSFFPVKDYPFLRSRNMWGFSYVEIIDTWKKQKIPIRLTIDTGGISFPCVVDSFKYSVGSTGDINYEITFGEFNLLEEDNLLSKEYEELKGMISTLTERINQITDPMIYNYIDDNMPEWARPTIQKLTNNGCLNGTGDGLDLDIDMLRLFKVMDNAQAMRNIVVYNYNDRNIPQWAQSTVNKLEALGYISGTGTDDNGFALYNLTDDLLRMLVILDRAGVFGDL